VRILTRRRWTATQLPGAASIARRAWLAMQNVWFDLVKLALWILFVFSTASCRVSASTQLNAL